MKPHCPLVLQPHSGLSVKVKPTLPKVELGVLRDSRKLRARVEGQNASHWGFLGVIGKVLKCRCLNWPRIGHLDICSPSYGQKKGWESNWQFDSRPLKVGNRPLPDVCSGSATRSWKALDKSYNFGLNLVPIRARREKLWFPKVPGVQIGTISRQFQDSTLGVPGKRAIWM
jgi:hypothetical protein